MQLDDTKPDDDFATAFASFAEPEVKSAPADAAVIDPPAEGTSDATTDGTAVVDGDGIVAPDNAPGSGGDVASVDGEAVIDPAAEPVAAVTPAVGDTKEADAILERLSKLVREAPAEARTETPTTAATPEPEIYTPEEKAFLTTYDADWADVAKGEGLKRKAEYRSIMQYMFSEIAKEFAPIRDMANELAARSALTDITSAVPDYNDKMRDDVVVWAGKQPEYLQTAYNRVIQEGTVGEVNDLIARYKKESGVGVTPPAASVTAPELSSAAKKAAASLAPVSTKRSVVEHQDDPSNFDAAFAKFSDMI